MPFYLTHPDPSPWLFLLLRLLNWNTTSIYLFHVRDVNVLHTAHYNDLGHSMLVMAITAVSFPVVIISQCNNTHNNYTTSPQLHRDLRQKPTYLFLQFLLLPKFHEHLSITCQQILLTDKQPNKQINQGKNIIPLVVVITANKFSNTVINNNENTNNNSENIVTIVVWKATD